MLTRYDLKFQISFFLNISNKKVFLINARHVNYKPIASNRLLKKSMILEKISLISSIILPIKPDSSSLNCSLINSAAFAPDSKAPCTVPV